MRGQRYPGRLELLFMDGRSEDGTRAILEELARADDRIVVLDNPHRGIPQALNIGLEEFIEHAYYDAGHMMYVRDQDRVKLSRDIRNFIRRR